MTTNPLADAAKLRELLEKATPGPWKTAIDSRTVGKQLSNGRWTILAERRAREDFLVGECPPDRNVAQMPHAAVRETDRRASDSNAALIVEAVNSLPALLDLLAAQASQIEALTAEDVYQAKLLLDIRNNIILFVDEIEDEGDRVYFGSTNHADYLRELSETLDEFQWSRMEKNAEGRDFYAELRGLRQELEAADTRTTAAEAKAAKMREALTPSGETKYAYMGEFSWTEWLPDEDGVEQGHERTVPWDTIKEIMKAIRERAGVEPFSDDADIHAALEGADK